MATPKKKILTPLETLMEKEGVKDQFINYIDGRIQSIEAQLDTFRRKRVIFEKQMADNFDWRSGAIGRELRASRGDLESEIFDVQNDTLNIVGGFAAFMTARTVDDILGTDPFYTLNPEGVSDDALAEVMQKHSEWKLRHSIWKNASIAAIEYAVGIGESVIKSTWVKEIDIFESREVILVDASKKPVLTSYGDNISEADIQLGQTVDGSGLPVPVITVPKDPSLVIDPKMVRFEEMEVEKINISYDNVKSHVIHFADLLIPENEPCLEDSNFVGHRSQRRLSELRSLYNLSDEVVALLKTDNTDPKTEQAKPKDHLSEQQEREIQTENPDPIIDLADCWVKFDPIGDGRQRRMYVLYARQHRVILTMDYIANITPEGILPFHVVRAFPVKDRWYGRGYYEIYDKAQEFIDRHLNYIANRNRYHANPAKFLQMDGLLEGEETEDFEFGPDKTYRLKPGITAKDVLSFVEMPDLDERTWQLMQMMIQVVQVRSGITSAAQGEVSSLPSTSTATGIESILQSASTLARLPMNSIKDGLEKSLLYCIKLIYANVDRDEVYTYMEGDQQKIGTLLAESVKNIDMNLKLLMTRFKQRESLESATKAVDLLVKGYIPLPEFEKGPVRTLFIQAIKALGYEQADSIVRPPMLPPAPDPNQPALPPGQPGQIEQPPQPPAQ